MDALLKIVQTVNAYLSDYILIILLVGTGLYFSIRTKFVQVRCFGEGWRRMFKNFSLHGDKHDSGMSSFQALATAIAAQVGTGNIVGACGAILTGGPGAIFWMWIIAFFGMATIYAEAVLAQETRTVAPDGTVQGGPGSGAASASSSRASSPSPRSSRSASWARWCSRIPSARPAPTPSVCRAGSWASSSPSSRRSCSSAA